MPDRMFSRPARSFALLAGILACLAAPAALAECWRYGEAPVVVRGILEQNTYPSLSRNGGPAETDYYVRLRAAACAVAGPTDRSDTEGRKGVWQVQLIVKPGQESQLRPRLGRAVQVRGRLLSFLAERQHAPLLLEVAGVEDEH